MFLQSLILRNFRNYKDECLNFHPRFNLIVGRNAQGKTNLLEAIYYIGYLTSFRTSTRRDLILENENAASVGSTLRSGEVDHDIRIHVEQNKRSVKLNGKQPSLYRDYYGLVPILLFEPRDVYLFRESPSIRRRFINRALFVDNPADLKLIRDYDQVVSQKNKLLKEDTPARMGELLAVWNERLLQLGARLMWRRLEWISNINPSLAEKYREFSQRDDNLEIVYRSTALRGSENDLIHLSEAEIAEQLGEVLVLKQDEERRRREALVGPHRDDWVTLLNGKPLGLFGSQGENRTAVIALRAAELCFVEKRRGHSPLFLLDDVASELDSVRIGSLLHSLCQNNGQVFLTTTEPAKISASLGALGASFLVEDGRVRMLGSSRKDSDSLLGTQGARYG